MNTVMIVAGESSGELYGSLLARALRAKRPDLRIIGLGGERMREAGVELISGIAHGFGLSEAVSAYRSIRETFNEAVRAIDKYNPDVLVLIDYPDFNIRLGKIAKKKGTKILYYVSPQVWAWRKGRVKTIASISDRIAVILPFEEELYRHTGTPCEFVGHPALEEIESLHQDRQFLKQSLGLDERPVLALLPGSRPHELKGLLPVMLDVVRNFKAEFAGYNYQFITPIAPNINIAKYESYFSMLGDEGVIIREDAVKVLSASDMAVIASGTAALQSAFVGTPMVVIYKLSPITYFLGRLVINVKYISLVNIITGIGVVKELLQSKADAKNIMDELKKIMLDKNYRDGMTGRFRSLRDIFSGRKPSSRVSEIVCEMLA